MRRTTLLILACVAAVVAAASAIVGSLIGQTASSAASAPSPPSVAPASRAPSLGELPREGALGQPPGALTEADGILPDGATVFDDYPAVGNLDPALLHALRDAATDAADAGIEFELSSGWRSPAYQDQLLRDAVLQYGSEAEAARWVATAATSAHVSGDAVDIGSLDAIEWLGGNGAQYGLCPTYDNEPWHYELRLEAPTLGCPPTYTDPTQDPRMRR
ncbi:M15 family metallopeptidase [Microbacterium sp. cf046]|uniref:M15 family metallopeptidase n=1 Tax=Microbacterium sp. cf046 TaxID=1761803 RepID=UPI000B8983B8|nr:M15 family metallopeptidase [Microbacterium sp. cf046]